MKLASNGGPQAVSRPIGAFTSIGQEEAQAASDVVLSGSLSGFFGSPRPGYFGGNEVQKLEAAWCERFGVEHALTVNSATSGLFVAMGAIGLSPGDEVIVPPYTMSATAAVPLYFGGIPRFVDIEEETFCLDVKLVEKAINEKTKAIVVVNLFGHPARLSELRTLADRHGIFLIEDNAQAVLGEENERKCGTVGHIGIYSLNIHKHIQCGEGGVCVTACKDLATRMAGIRNHGENVIDWLEISDLSNMIGLNLRMPEVSAAIASVQLKKLDPLVERVEKIGQTLTKGISGLSGFAPPTVRDGCRHNYFMWSCRYDEAELGLSRTSFIEHMRAEGVPLAGGYVPPLYRLPAFQKRMGIGRDGFPFDHSEIDYADTVCPVVERMHESELVQFQPVSWDVDDEQLEMMIEAFYKVVRLASSKAA